MGYSKASEIDWSSQKKGVMLFVKEYRPSKLLSSKNSIMGGFCLCWSKYKNYIVLSFVMSRHSQNRFNPKTHICDFWHLLTLIQPSSNPK